MAKREKNTEKLILEAATKVFLEKGFDGARMQEIADKAAINKALVHYYFRSKEKLFDAIFQEAFVQFIPKVMDVMTSDSPLFEKIKAFVNTYISMLIKNPHLPIFILHELNRHPEQMVNRIQSFGAKPELLVKNIIKEIKKGKIRPVDPRQLIVNMIGLFIFPFAGRPIIQGVIFKNDDKTYNRFLEDRKKDVADFIIHSISIKK